MDDFSLDVLEIDGAEEGVRKGSFTLTPETAMVECDCDGLCYQSSEESEVAVLLEEASEEEAYKNVGNVEVDVVDGHDVGEAGDVGKIELRRV